MTTKFDELSVVISPKFTQDTLKNIIGKLIDETDVEIINWNLELASGKGDNYLSIVYRLTIFAKLINNQQDFTAKVIVKALPRSLASRKLFRSEEFFRNEIYFYKYIVPEFEKFLKSKNCEDLLSIPKCLALESGGSNEFLVLEDGKAKGFGHITPRQKPWSFDDVQLILKTLANFHAISFGYKHENPSEFTKFAGSLEEKYFHEKNWELFNKHVTLYVDIAKDALAKEYEGTPEQQKFASISPKDLFFRSVACCKRQNHPASVINHGDSWPYNFLLSPIDSTDRRGLLIDFQLARCASCISDVSYFLYSSTDKATRDQHFQSLLKDYYNQLDTSIERLIGAEARNIFTWDIFMKEIEECFIQGFCFAIDNLTVAMLDESEAFDVESIKEDNTANFSEIFKRKPIESPEKRKRLADVVIHAIHQGFL